MQNTKHSTKNDSTLVVTHETPLGRISIALHGAALRAVGLDADDAIFTRQLAGNAGVRFRAVDDLDDTHADIVDALRRYFAGDVHAIDSLPVRATGSPFQQRVWDALREIPAGETVSYAQLATTVGTPTASRAVGRANGTNPVPIVVPCHRVIRADGTLGGYGGGLDRKRWLLAHELRHVGSESGRLTV
jgi:methylated-DNA-[protein]-cysteine S-methyltransferase